MRRQRLLVALAFIAGLLLNYDVLLRSAASFPSAIKAFTTKNNGDKVQAQHVNDLQDEVTAMEQDLVNGMSRVRLSAATLTIASDAVTATKSLHAVDTEGAAPTDNLATINTGSGVGAGHLLTLYAANVGHVVTVQDAVGNVQLAGGDYVLDSAKKSILLRFDGSNWVEISRALFVDPQTPRVYVTNSATQSIPDNTNTVLSFDTESFDVGPMHDVVLNTSRLTVPVGKGGFYLIGAASLFANNATGQRFIQLRVNGSTLIEGSQFIVSNPGATFSPSVRTQAIRQLSAGDYVEVLVYQNSGGALAAGSATDWLKSMFYMTKL